MVSKMADNIQIQTQDFNLQAEYDQLRACHSGAIVTFTGLVRDFDQAGDEAKVEALHLQHYPGMTERLLAEMIAEARSRWAIDGVRIIHRVGELLPGDQIVLVAVSAAHREAAFNAASFLMDYLKTQATFWKKTVAGGEAHWLDMKETDKHAAARWQQTDNEGEP